MIQICIIYSHAANKLSQYATTQASIGFKCYVIREFEAQIQQLNHELKQQQHNE